MINNAEDMSKIFVNGVWITDNVDEYTIMTSNNEDVILLPDNIVNTTDNSGIINMPIDNPKVVDTSDNISEGISKPKRKSPAVKYDGKYLSEFCDTNGITLLKDYSTDKITNKTKIIAKCVSCANPMVEKKFYELVNSRNFGCKECGAKITKERLEATNMKERGVKCVFQSLDIQKKIEETLIRLHNVSHVSQIEGVKEKISASRRKNKPEIIEKEKFIGPKKLVDCYDYNNLVIFCDEHGITLLDDYSNKPVIHKTIIKAKCINCDNPMVEKNFHELRRSLNFGCKNCKKTIMMERTKKTNMLVRGVEFTLQCPEALAKAQQTCLLKYNETHPMRSRIVKDRVEKTNFLRIGFRNPMQCPIIAQRCLARSFRMKKYIFPSGRIDYVQGYEPFALNHLLKIEKISEDDIITSRVSVPTIWYTDKDGNTHRYYVDIYIPSLNKCIEVKSLYTASLRPEILQLKEQAVIDTNHDFKMLTFNKKGQQI
jgi:transposase-like protein